MAASSVGEALEAAVDAITAAGVATPRLDAEVMLEHATGLDRTRFVTDPAMPMPGGSAKEFAAMVRRRVAREPVAYIIGVKGFRRILLECDGRALIPRPETELLVEVAIGLAPRRVLDVGTGAGAVALAIADEVEGAEIVATDTSAPALTLARRNAHRLGLSDRVRFEAGSVPRGTFDLVVANLPYVPSPAGLAPEITKWEPREAIFGGPDGLDVIREVMSELGPPGSGARAQTRAVALEIGEGQGTEVAALVEQAGFTATEGRLDLAVIERVIVGKAP